MKRTIIGLRKDLGMSREEYANALGIKKNTLSRYEQGKSIPDANVAIKIMHLSKITNVEDVNWG